MNSESGKRCSIEELKEKNLPREYHPTSEEWDKLLAILSALYRLTVAQTGLALGHPDFAGLVGDVVQWGRHMEQSADAPLPTAPVSGHTDRKALSKEREKKIALGHKPDDHEERQDMTLSM